MRIAAFSDVHGNLTALEAVLRDIETQASIDLMICLGDLAYKGPAPAECVQKIRSLGIPTVHGNTDHYLLTLEDYDVDCPMAERVKITSDEVLYLQWHMDAMAHDDIDYLSTLPFEYRIEIEGLALQFLHASPKNCLADIRPTQSRARLDERLSGTDADWIIMGHIHQPFTLKHGKKLLINVGAVGFSLDGDWRASYAILDTELGEVSCQRVEFDIRACIDLAKQKDFCFAPEWYGDALRQGWWEPIPYSERHQIDRFPKFT